MMTIHELIAAYVLVEHVIPTVFPPDLPARREDAFLRARESMADAIGRGRPFVASDGHRALVVAVPGHPLMVPDSETGDLRVTPEQDFVTLLQMVW